MPKGTALIYKISSPKASGAYIGSTIEPNRRWRLHRLELKKGKHTSFVLQRAWDKHEGSNFTFEPLLVCSVKDRDLYEYKAIEILGSYNLRKEASGQIPGGWSTGYTHTDEGRANLKAGAHRRWARESEEIFTPLCEKAWVLHKTGMTKSKACKIVGISPDPFWRWLEAEGKKIDYTALCEKAWGLVKSGMNRTAAHKTVGISRDTFWNWIQVNGLKKDNFIGLNREPIFCAELQTTFLSGKDAAKYLGVCPATISKYIKSKGKVGGLYTLEKVA